MTLQPQWPYIHPSIHVYITSTHALLYTYVLKTIYFGHFPVYFSRAWAVIHLPRTHIDTHIYACAHRDRRVLSSETQNNVYFCHQVGVILYFINQTHGNTYTHKYTHTNIHTHTHTNTLTLTHMSYTRTHQHVCTVCRVRQHTRISVGSERALVCLLLLQSSFYDYCEIAKQTFQRMISKCMHFSGASLILRFSFWKFHKSKINSENHKCHGMVLVKLNLKDTIVSPAPTGF